MSYEDLNPFDNDFIDDDEEAEFSKTDVEENSPYDDDLLGDIFDDDEGGISPLGYNTEEARI